MRPCEKKEKIITKQCGDGTVALEARPDRWIRSTQPSRRYSSRDWFICHNVNGDIVTCFNFPWGISRRTFSTIYRWLLCSESYVVLRIEGRKILRCALTRREW